MKKFITKACIMAVVLFIGVGASMDDPVLAQGRFGGPDGKGFLNDLTDQQRETIQEKREEMRNQGATREEIHAAVVEMLKEYGVELPEDWGEGCRGGHKGFLNNLTDQQREAVHDKIQQMQDEGVSPQEIHAAMSEMLKGYGIELPENCPGPMGPGKFGFGASLTDEQREAIRSKTEEMRDQGATPEEIGDAVDEMLKSYGIEVPDDWHGPPPFGHPWGDFPAGLTNEQREALRKEIDQMRSRGAAGIEIQVATAEILEGYGIQPPGPWGDLTAQQRETVRQKMKLLLTQGADRKEIHAQLAKMLKDYGVELPEHRMGPRGSGAGPGLWAADLTDEQRQTVREKIHQMRSQGATRQQIRAAVSEMIQQYGIQSPEASESIPAGITSAEPNIVAGSYPNPFNPETQISYSLGVSEDVRIQIFNVSGQLIRTYDLGYQPAGSYSVKWDGRNGNGNMAASGVYLYRIQAGANNVTNRMVLLK